MLSKLIIAWGVMAASVAIHSLGLTGAFYWLKRRADRIDGQFWPATWLLTLTAGWTMLIHLLQITAWALVYASMNAMPDLPSALYFSAVTYTTTGYGDLVLPEDWRLVGGVEALTGILMCGLSTGFSFAVFSKIFGFAVKSRSPA